MKSLSLSSGFVMFIGGDFYEFLMHLSIYLTPRPLVMNYIAKLAGGCFHLLAIWIVTGSELLGVTPVVEGGFSSSRDR